MRTRQLLVSQDTETDDRVDREVCRRVNARSMVVVPLRHRDRSQGVLKVVSADPHAFSAADVRLLEQLAEFIASALSRATVIDDPLRDARVDSLTGLANRAAFLGQLDAAISAAAVQHRIAAVLYLDLDGFKPINDTHGHAVGDEVLREVGARIARLCGESDLPARIVGDVAIVSGGDLAEAVLARADASMYSDKRGKRQVGDVPAEVTEVITAMIAVRRGPDVESAVRCRRAASPTALAPLRQSGTFLAQRRVVSVAGVDHGVIAVDGEHTLSHVAKELLETAGLPSLPDSAGEQAVSGDRGRWWQGQLQLRF